MAKKAIIKVAGIASAALIMSGCSGGSSVGGDPEWTASFSQSSEVPAETVALLEKTEPQFKTDNYSATVVSLGERVETSENKKVARFAVSANLPGNCLSAEGKDIAADDACLSFMYGAVTEGIEQDGKPYKLPLNNYVDTVFFETTNGMSIVEVSSPMDTHRYAVYMIADGESLMINPVSGEILTDSTDIGTKDSVGPAQL